MDKREVVRILEEIALLLELKGENPFKVRAYTTAARALEGTPVELGDLVASGRLGELPGVGEALKEKIATLVSTGRLPYYDDLRSQFRPQEGPPPLGRAGRLHAGGAGICMS